MSRRKGWLFFVLGLILALGAGALVFVVLEQQASAATEQSRRLALEKYPTMKLPVAARPLEAGTTIGATDYVLKDFPLDLVPIGAISQTATLDEQFIVSAIGQGETFHSSQFLGGQGTTLSQQIPQGKVLFAFPILDLMSKSDLIKDGDHVDLLLSLPLKDSQGHNSGQSTGYTVQNIDVFKVLRTVADDKKQLGDPTALLCSLTPQDAVLIKAVKDSGGTIDVTLRSPADKQPFDTPAIDHVELSDLYKLK